MAGELYLNKPTIKKKKSRVLPVAHKMHDLASAHLFDPHLRTIFLSLSPSHTGHPSVPQTSTIASTSGSLQMFFPLPGMLFPGDFPTACSFSSSHVRCHLFCHSLINGPLWFSSQHLNIQNYLSSLLVWGVWFFFFFFLSHQLLTVRTYFSL